MTIQYMGNNDYEVFLNHQEPIIMSREDLIALNHEMMKTFSLEAYSTIYKNQTLKGFDEESLQSNGLAVKRNS